jgi:hypothetical protein
MDTVRKIYATILTPLLLASPAAAEQGPNDQSRPLARASSYDSCILENASAIQKAGNDNALDVIMLSCIRQYEEAIGGDEIGKIKVPSLSYGALGFTGVGLIAQIYNGSDYDITAITFVLNDKKVKEQRAYEYNQFIQFYRGPGIPVGSPAPQYRRFIRKHTQGEYTFPLEFPGLVQNDFFKKYEVVHFTARGVRQ